MLKEELSEAQTISRRPKRNKQIVRKLPKKVFGQWSEDEHFAYLSFVHTFPQIFDKAVTKSMHSFKKMAQFIRTRTPTQCRSHHQKMLLNPYVQNIVSMGMWMNNRGPAAVPVKHESEETEKSPPFPKLEVKK